METPAAGKGWGWNGGWELLFSCNRTSPEVVSNMYQWNNEYTQMNEIKNVDQHEGACASYTLLKSPEYNTFPMGYVLMQSTGWKVYE
jgi:hypothetical protein